jgi:hypothetical protein
MTTKKFNVLLPHGDGLKTVEVEVTRMTQGEAESWPEWCGSGRYVFAVECEDTLTDKEYESVIEQFHRR